MSKINENIIGYEIIKDCTDAYGCERTRCDLLFAVKRGARDSEDAYLKAIAEVRPNTSENRRIMEEKFPFENYIIWCGTIQQWVDGCKEIEFYWS